MDFFSFASIILIILAVCVVVVYAYAQQARRLQVIQDQLAKIEDNKPELIRQERAQWLDPLIMMEVQLNQSKEPVLDEMMLQQIEEARSAIKSLNERLVGAKEWMGAPFDLEWVEYLDRMPTLKRLYVDTVFERDEHNTSSQIVKE